MYDHNQTLVPESFLSLHSRHGRPLLPRDEMEARHDLCEDTAVHAAAFLAANGHGAGSASEADVALRRCHAGLVAAPASFSAAEAAWIVRRVAELQEWPQPQWLDV